VRRLLEDADITTVRSLVGSYVTSLEMAGCSVTVSMLDVETKRLWDAPVHAPALRWGA
jgi:dihydroxyacetone kinase-like protein